MYRRAKVDLLEQGCSARLERGGPSSRLRQTIFAGRNSFVILDLQGVDAILDEIAREAESVVELLDS